MTQKPTFSVLIYTEHEPESLADTLQAINDQTYDWSSIEVIVIDQLESRARMDVASTFGVKYIAPQRPNRADAWNEAVAAANGDYIVFTDDDCQPNIEWLNHYAAALSEGAAMVGGPDKVPKGTSRFLKYLDYILTSFVGSAGLRTKGRGRNAYYPRHWNMALPKKMIFDLGGFRGDLADAIELDMANRVRRAGHTVKFAPEAAVLHQRETNMWGFLRRNICLAWVRSGLPQKRLVYAAPAIFGVVVGGLFVAAPSVPITGVVVASVLGAYALVILCSGVHASIQMRDPLALFAVSPLLVLQHLTHAIGYGVGIIAHGLSRITGSHRNLGCDPNL